MCNVQRKGQGNTFLCDCRTRLECPGGCGTRSKRSVSLAEPLFGTGSPLESNRIRRSLQISSISGQAASYNSIQIHSVLGRPTAFGKEDRYQSNIGSGATAHRY